MLDSISSMEQSPSCEANRFSADEEILIFYDSEASTICPYPHPDHPAHASPSYFLKIHFNIILPSMPVSYEWSFSLGSLHQNCVCEMF